MFSRRSFMRAFAFSSVAAIAACAQATSSAATRPVAPSPLDQAASDISLIANGLAAVLPLIPDVPAAVTAAVQAINMAAASPSASSAQTIASEVSSLVPLVPGLPSSAAIAIQAAESLLPGILAAFGVVGASILSATGLPSMAPGDAREALRAMIS